MKFLILCAVTIVLLAQLTLAVHNGAKAERDQFDFMVRLVPRLSTGKNGSCGGSIISEEWILTAAHCLPKNVISVDIYFDTIKRSEAPVIVNVEKNRIITHPEFSPKSMRNDIALIMLGGLDNSDNFVVPIALPRKNATYEDGRNITVLGWGRMDNTGVVTEDLQWANMQIMPIQSCIDKYDIFLIKNASNICLKSEDNTSICSGDSGGPAVGMTASGEPELVGLISFSKDATCPNGMPAVLTRINNKYLDWIALKTGIVSK